MGFRIDLYGDLPVHTTGPNKGRLDRKAVTRMYGFSYQEISKAYGNWISGNDRFRNSTLTFKGYLDKLVCAGITPSQVGTGLKEFNLARYNDEGPYTEESCRFISIGENLLEQDRSISLYEKTVRRHGKEKTTEMWQERGRKCGKALAGKPKKKRSKEPTFDFMNL